MLIYSVFKKVTKIICTVELSNDAIGVYCYLIKSFHNYNFYYIYNSNFFQAFFGILQDLTKKISEKVKASFDNVNCNKSYIWS